MYVIGNGRLKSKRQIDKKKKEYKKLEKKCHPVKVLPDNFNKHIFILQECAL